MFVNLHDAPGYSEQRFKRTQFGKKPFRGWFLRSGSRQMGYRVAERLSQGKRVARVSAAGQNEASVFFLSLGWPAQEKGMEDWRQWSRRE